MKKIYLRGGCVFYIRDFAYLIIYDLSTEKGLESLLIFTPSGGTEIQDIEDIGVDDDEDEGFI